MFSNIRKWPIKQQIMTSFVTLTISLQIIVFLIIYLSIKYTSESSIESFRNLVKIISQDTMQYIAKEKGNLIDQKSSIFGGQTFILGYLLSEIMDFKELSVGYELLDSYTYDELIANTTLNLTFKNDSDYGNYPITFNCSSFWKPSWSVSTEEGDKFIRATAQLDRFMGSLFLTPGANPFKRFNFYYINGDTHILRTYPAEKIQNPELALNLSNTDYEYHYQYASAILKDYSFYPFAFLTGPYSDAKTYGLPMVSTNAFMMINDTFKGILQMELKKSYFNNYTHSLFLPTINIFYSFYLKKKDLKFLNTGYGMLFNNLGIVIGNAAYWNEFSDSKLISVTEIINRTDITQDYLDILLNATENDKNLREISVLDFYYNYQSYYESTALLPYNIQSSKVSISSLSFILYFWEKFKRWEFGVKLYVEKSEIDSIEVNVLTLMSKNRDVIIFLASVLCSITLGLVIISSITVTKSISKPLKALIRVADVINNRITEEEAIQDIQAEIKTLPEGEFQLRHLVVAFKNFMSILDNQKRARETKILNKPLFYPLNQYHHSFVQNAKKGNSEINWAEVLEQISNEVDEGILEMELGFEDEMN